MSNSLFDIFNKRDNNIEKNALVGRLLTPQEIDAVVGGSTSCPIGAGGSTHSQGGGSYTQGGSGSYTQGGTGGGSYTQTC